MNFSLHRFFARAAASALAALAAATFTAAAWSHGAEVGSVHVGHPYATPSLAGVSTGAAYFAMLSNAGDQPERLVRASTPVAASVEFHTMAVDAQGIARMRQVDGFALPPKSDIRMRPGMGMHLMLIGLKQPLKEGDSFPMTLEFQHAGKVDVKVMVQTVKGTDTMADGHMH